MFLSISDKNKVLNKLLGDFAGRLTREKRPKLTKAPRAVGSRSSLDLSVQCGSLASMYA